MARVEEDDIETDAGDPDYDSWLFLPFVREGRRDVPYRLSAHYARHKCSWGSLPMDRQVADLERLLPQIKALRKPKRSPRVETNPAHDQALSDLGVASDDRRGKEAFDIKSITDALRWKDIETSDDVLILNIIADVRFPTGFWLKLREKHSALIAAVERACRPGMNGKVGRKADKPMRHADTQDRMAKFAAELPTRMAKLKRFYKKNEKLPTLRAEQVEAYVKDLRDDYPIFKRPAVILELTKKLERDERPSDLVAWLARLQFPPDYKKKRVKSR